MLRLTLLLIIFIVSILGFFMYTTLTKHITRSNGSINVDIILGSLISAVIGNIIVLSVSATLIIIYFMEKM